MQTQQPQPGSTRASLRQKHGLDCYDEAETEFLTGRGWQRFDEVRPDDLLAAVDATTGELRWERYLERFDQIYSGPLYTVEAYLTRCRVTPNHRMLVSPA